MQLNQSTILFRHTGALMQTNLGIGNSRPFPAIGHHHAARFHHQRMNHPVPVARMFIAHRQRNDVTAAFNCTHLQQPSMGYADEFTIRHCFREEMLPCIGRIGCDFLRHC